MKKFGLLVTMMFVSSLLFTGCGNSSNVVTDTVNNGDTPPIVVIPGGDSDDSGDSGDTVEGTSSAVFSFSKPSPVAIYVGTGFNPREGVTVFDPVDGDLTGNIVMTTDLDTSVAGEYTIVYSITDSSDITLEVTRTVVVLDVPENLPVESDTEISGTALDCTPTDVGVSVDAADFNASQAFKTAISSPMLDIESRELQTSHNTIARLSMVMAETNTTGGQISSTLYHPLVVSYLEHYPGSDYEMGDGSADIGDPDNVDMVKVALSRDNGKTWKRQFVSFSPDSNRSSIEVEWAGQNIEYPQDAQKPDMLVSGNRILVAWNDKYCPSGNPYDLDAVDENGNVVDPQTYDGNITYPNDAFAVNGPQGFIDYREENNLTGQLEAFIAPNGKPVYQVPFSCIWTVRGLVDGTTGDITWHAPMQLTSGTRDSNHIRLAASSAGFAISWQEDIMGLKSGKGAGPGEGWSGATTNRGSEIWYTAIKAADFDAATAGVDPDAKPVSVNNFKYPVRMTDNEQCKEGDRKVYCNYYCDKYGSLPFETGNQTGDIVDRCLTSDEDMLTDTVVVLDGDTGASRSALSIFETNSAGESVVVIGYEETKALKEKVVAEGDQDQGEIPTVIEDEGKSVYFESFDFNAFFDFDESNVSTIQTTAMPIVSAGNIINPKSPSETNTSEMIYENARRLVIGEQIDECDAQTPGDRTFAILYKQSFDTRGSSSDMFVRAWEGFKYSDIAPIGTELNVTNVSAQSEITPADPALYTVSWSTTNLDDLTYENKRENTFSPRIFLRGTKIFTGFEYTPYETFDGEVDPVLVAKYPNNFHTNIYDGTSWQGPKNITKVTDSSKNTVDARFFTTPKGNGSNGVESDKSNPEVLFVTWGTTLDANTSVYFDTNISDIELEIHEDLVDEIDPDDARFTAEADLFFVRSTDSGQTWEEEQNLSSVSRVVVEEKEVESFATPDGKHIYNVWIQQSVLVPDPDVAVTGLDSWFGRVDYNISK